MTDQFALLDEPRAVWLDTEALKTKFHERSAAFHPDRFHNSPEEEKAEANRHYAELNAAYTCLSQTKSRLQHFLELEAGQPPEAIQQPPADLMDLFFECGSLTNGIDQFLREKEAADSPLLKVKFFEQSMDWTEKVEQFNARLAEKIAQLETKLQSSPSPSHQEIEDIYRRLSYYERWRSQLQERFVKLSL